MRRSSGQEKHSPQGREESWGPLPPSLRAHPASGLSPFLPFALHEGKQFSGNAKVSFFWCFSLLALLPEEAGPHMCSCILSNHQRPFSAVWKSSLVCVMPYSRYVACSPNTLSQESGTPGCEPVTPGSAELPGAGGVHGKQARLAPAQCQ